MTRIPLSMSGKAIISSIPRPLTFPAAEEVFTASSGLAYNVGLVDWFQHSALITSNLNMGILHQTLTGTVFLAEGWSPTHHTIYPLLWPQSYGRLPRGFQDLPDPFPCNPENLPQFPQCHTGIGIAEFDNVPASFARLANHLPDQTLD